MANPFIVGPPVRGADLCGRDRELERIGSALRSGGLASVSGVPGAGLTSLALAAAERLGRADRPAIRLDMAEAEDAEEAEDLLARALGRLPGGRPEAFHLVLDGVRREAAGDAAVALLERTRDRRAGTLLLGSPRLLPERLRDRAGAGEEAGPDLALALSPPPEPAWMAHVLERFLETDRWIGNEHVREVLEATRSLPRATQAVLRRLWDATDADGRVRDGAVERALAAAVDRESGGYRLLMDGLTENQRRVLRGLARRPDAPPFSGAFVAGQGLASPSSVQRALQSLESLGLVRRDGADRPRPVDPLLERWLRRAEAGAVVVKR